MALARSALRALVPFALVASSGLAGSCDATPSRPAAQENAGRAVAVENPTQGMPPGHPAVAIGAPESNQHRTGRAPRRLSVDQLRESLLAATGHTWIAQRTVITPAAPGGQMSDPRADMLEALAATLGRPDYNTTTSEALAPSVTFSKLASDAARAACRAGVDADVQAAAGARRMLRYVDPTATFERDGDAVRRNVAYMALRFWGRDLAPDATELAPLVDLFRRASTAPAGTDRNGVMRTAGTPADGWRAVCIALATDPQFLTY